MRILFVLKQMGYVRHFTSVVRALAERGHAVVLASQDGEPLPPALEGHAAITAIAAPSKRRDEWQEYASLVRRTADYLRYATPPFARAGKLRARAFDKLVQTVSNRGREARAGWSDIALGLTPAEVERLQGLMRTIEASIPADRALSEFIAAERPDLLLITPLIDIGSGQTDYVKAARALGIPSAMVLFSWDNLSTKGLIHDVPDAVLVWNELQRDEAQDLHGIPGKRIVITGAPRFDDFFAASSVISRDTFCRELDLDPAQPIIAYLGSSRFVAEHEEAFIDQWLRAIRATPALQHANVLIKPHPDLHRNWEEEGERLAWDTPAGTLRLRKHKPFAMANTVAVRAPFSATQFLYECLFHSAAVVGLNTSAELEAGIVGRPVFTIHVSEQYADGQEGTLHFHYLLASNGGYVETAADLSSHCEQLTRALAGNHDPERTRRFIERFLRPHGIHRPASKQMVRAIERLPERAAKRRAKAEITGAPPPSAAVAVEESQVALLDYAPAAIRLVASSAAERKWRMHACRKEPWTVEWLERSIRPDAVLYDIGANVGTFTLIAAKRAAGARVVAFEPGYASFAHLCDNLVLNSVSDAVIPVPMPLWSRTGMVSFKYRSTEAGQSRHAMRDAALRTGAGARYVQPVFAYRLDDLVQQFALPAPTHLKLDVDGAEVEVLRGAEQTLRRPELESLLVEYEDAVAAEVAALVAAAGFRLAKQIERAKPEAPLYAEFRRDR